MPETLTVLITCKNEESNIGACVESARPLADEILIADSGSTDATLDIVGALGGCRIIERTYVSAGDFKNWAIPQSAGNWVFVLDADERITAELAGEIRRVLAGPAPLDGYWVYRANHFLGHRIRFSGWSSDKVLRLFRRDQGRYAGETDHAEINLPRDRVGRLRYRLWHYPCWSYDQYFHKIHRYTSWQAQCWHAAGRRSNPWKLLLSGPFRFLHSYVVRGGFLDGLAGFQVCALTGIYSFMKQARLWQLEHGLEQPDAAGAGRRASSRAA